MFVCTPACLPACLQPLLPHPSSVDRYWCCTPGLHGGGAKYIHRDPKGHALSSDSSDQLYWWPIKLVPHVVLQQTESDVRWHWQLGCARGVDGALFGGTRRLTPCITNTDDESSWRTQADRQGDRARLDFVGRDVCRDPLAGADRMRIVTQLSCVVRTANLTTTRNGNKLRSHDRVCT